MTSILIGTLKSLFFSKAIEGTQKFNFKVLVYLAIAVTILFLYLSNSGKNKEIANLTSQVTKLKSDISVLSENINSCNAKVDKQNLATNALASLTESLDLKLKKAHDKKLELEKKVESLIQSAKAPKDCEGATSWLVDKTEELKKWRN